MGIKCSVCGVTGVDELFYGREGDLYCATHRPDEGDELRAALRALVEPDPMIAQSDSSLICFFCCAGEYDEHYPDCAWVVAKALLSPE